jgi:hypothetical protein
MNKKKLIVESYYTKIQRLNEELLANIKKNLPELEELLEKISGDWFYADHLYRQFHHSYKTYYAQDTTVQIVEALKKLAPKSVTFNEEFEQIFKKGTGKKFKTSHNKNWFKHTRPIIEAMFYAKALLEMCVKYGKELEKAPECLPNGWALTLYFYNLR